MTRVLANGPEPQYQNAEGFEHVSPDNVLGSQAANMSKPCKSGTRRDVAGRMGLIKYPIRGVAARFSG